MQKYKDKLISKEDQMSFAQLNTEEIMLNN
jgi:hypothetical protein